MKKSVLVAIHIALITICVLVYFYLTIGSGFTLHFNIREDNGISIIKEANVPLENPTQLAGGDNTIFIYYESTGLVNAYSIDGSFLYGLHFKDIKNGRGEIAFDNDLLYILARDNTVYVLNNGKLIGQYSESEMQLPEKFDKEKLEVFVDGHLYKYTNGGIERISPFSENEVVIELPRKSSIIDVVITAIPLIFLCLFRVLKEEQQKIKGHGDKFLVSLTTKSKHNYQ